MGQAIKSGGSWIDNSDNCRSAYRNNYTRDDRNNNIGFRVVCVAPSTLLCQSWQMGICRACVEESRPVPVMRMASENTSESISLVSRAETLTDSTKTAILKPRLSLKMVFSA